MEKDGCTVKIGALELGITDGRVALRRFGGFCNRGTRGISEISLTGENRTGHMGTKLCCSSEGDRLRYVSHETAEGRTEVVQQNERLRVRTVFEPTADGNAVGIFTELENRTDWELETEEVSAFLVRGIGTADECAGNLILTRFAQSHHAECQPVRTSFRELGLARYPHQPAAQGKFSIGNVGSWSTKEFLPQGIVEDERNGCAMMFQIESSASWYAELSEQDGQYYLWLGGATRAWGDWCHRLAPGESYRTPRVTLAFGRNAEEAIGAMTAWRRSVSGLSAADLALPAIFNEYMYLSWDSPEEARVRRVAPTVARMGMQYYVIDCGWHDEVDTKGIYAYVGEWRESHRRFPGGLRATADYLRSLGLRMGLWIEPEVVGVKCERMLAFYDDDCFISRHGRRICAYDRYFLDYRSERVRTSMTETIRRMVEDYGADYIKFDYNQDLGVGGDRDAASAGDGLERSTAAFLSWVEELKLQFPQVIFEACASGGLRMDARTLSVFSLTSTSDQTDYLRYPYIAGNVLSAVLPEQAAVWSYPVAELAERGVEDDRVIVNMVNGLLGRLHLASDLTALTERQLALVREGVLLGHELADFKRRALPYFPLGLNPHSADAVAAGLRCGDRCYLAVWCLRGETCVRIPSELSICSAEVVYPSETDVDLTVCADAVEVEFHRAQRAVLLRIDRDAEEVSER